MIQEKLRKKITINLLIIVVMLIIGTTGFSFAYLKTQGNTGSMQKIDLSVGTTDNLEFLYDKSSLNMLLSQDTFKSGSGNQSGTITGTAKLTAKSDDTSLYSYDVYLDLTNDFVYTTDSNLPEIVLSIKKDGVEVTSLSGLSYVSATNGSGITINGFDITTKTGRITIKKNVEIKATKESTTTHKWEFTITMVNLATNQSDNAQKTFDASIYMDYKDTVSIGLYATGGSIGTNDESSKVISANVNTTYKQATEYAEPTRYGYTFVKWGSSDGNLFDKTATPYATKTYIQGDGTMVSYTEFSIYKIEISPNTGYIIYNSGGSTAPGYAIYDASGTRLSGESYQNQSVVSFTTPSTAAYILFSVVTNSTYRYDFDYFTIKENNSEVITKDSYVLNKDHNLFAIWQAGTYTVTFDANGGSVSPASKKVTYNSTYGTLPVPTKSGYTFAGWVGKNLFNKNATAAISSSYIKGDGTVVSLSEYTTYQIDVLPNTTYTITNSGNSNAPGYVIYDANGTRLSGENYQNRKTVTFKTDSTAAYMKFSVVTSSTSSRYDLQTFQIEKGSSSTSYESHFITSSSTVKKASNHTLTAEWMTS